MNGKLNGRKRVYHPSGRLQIEGYFKNGIEEGLVKVYDEKGNPVEEIFYEDGVKVKITKFDKE